MTIWSDFFITGRTDRYETIDKIARSTTYRNAIVIRQGRTGCSASAIAEANPALGGQAHEQD